MGKYTRQPIISEAYVEAAKKLVEEVGLLESQRELRTREPHLYDVLCKYSNRALADRPESLSDETQSAIYDAMWRGAMVAIEAYRVAQYHLWADTCLGPQMERLDPNNASGRFGAADRRRHEAESVDDDNANNDEPDGDKGAAN
jgi:hypothetical protein